MLNRILGNAIQIDNDVAMQELHPFLTHDEDIQLSFKVMRDMIIFTDLRMILVDVQGITGKKREYHSIPYKSITHFSIESGGRLDLDVDLKIYLSGRDFPIERKLKKGAEVLLAVQRALAYYVLAK